MGEARVMGGGLAARVGPPATAVEGREGEALGPVEVVKDLEDAGVGGAGAKVAKAASQPTVHACPVKPERKG